MKTILLRVAQKIGKFQVNLLNEMIEEEKQNNNIKLVIKLTHKRDILIECLKQHKKGDKNDRKYI